MTSELSREEELEAMLRRLIDYTVDILTGPIMREHIKWPEGGPRTTSPVLVEAQWLLDQKRDR